MAWRWRASCLCLKSSLCQMKHRLWKSGFFPREAAHVKYSINFYRTFRLRVSSVLWSRRLRIRTFNRGRTRWKNEEGRDSGDICRQQERRRHTNCCSVLGRVSPKLTDPSWSSSGREPWSNKAWQFRPTHTHTRTPAHRWKCLCVCVFSAHLLTTFIQLNIMLTVLACAANVEVRF